MVVVFVSGLLVVLEVFDDKAPDKLKPELNVVAILAGGCVLELSVDKRFDCCAPGCCVVVVG